MTFLLCALHADDEQPRYAGLTQETLYYLRESYEELADYFAARGETKRANEMRQRAQEVPLSEEILNNPPVHPSRVHTNDLPAPKVPVRKGKESRPILSVPRRSLAETESLENELKNLQKPDPSQLQESANYLVNRYLLGLITKNLEAVSAFFAAHVAFPGYDQTLSKEELTQLYAELLATYQLESLNIGDFYQLEITPQLRKLDENHIEYILHAQGHAPAALQNSGYWKEFFGNVHVYTFTKEGTDWYLTSLRTLPLE